MIHGGGLLCLLLAPRLNVTSTQCWVQLFLIHNISITLIKETGSVGGSLVSQWPAPSHSSSPPQRTCRCTVHKITAQTSLFGHQHPINPTWHPSSCSHPARPWLHRLELNVSTLTKGSRAPGATIFSQLGAPSRHVGTGPGAGTAARTGSAPEFYSAQQAMLLLQLP